MKGKKIAILGAVLLAAVFSFDGCKKADVESATLTVILSQGVSGTPGAGTYTLKVGDERAYSYSLEAGYTKLTVLLDGTEVASSGTVTMSGNHTLQAYSDDNRQYALSVTVGAGVAGTPAAGTYYYTQGTKVEYSYSLLEGYTAMSIKLDGIDVVAKGTITMTEDFALSVSASEKFDVRGSWALSESYNDGSSFAVTAAFEGGYSAGTVTDSAGGSGTYTYEDASIEFTLVFPDVTYEYTGSFSAEDTMSGTCKRYRTKDNVISGSWSATRSASVAAAPRTQTGWKGSSK